MEVADEHLDKIYKSRWGGGGSTVLFVAWDDVLFPTTDLLTRLRLPSPEIDSKQKVKLRSYKLAKRLETYQEVLAQFLSTAGKMSDRFVILCDRQPGWVEACVQAYLPELIPLFIDGARRLPRMRIAYPNQEFAIFKEQFFPPKSVRAGSTGDLCPSDRKMPQVQSVEVTGLETSWWKRALGCASSCKSPEEKTSSQDPVLTRAAHLVTMKVQATQLASQRPFHGAISIGTYGPQQEAFKLFKDVMANNPTHKMVLVPEQPTIEQLALRLRFDIVLLPVYTIVRRSFRVDMSGSGDALQNLASSLGMPRLSRPSFPRFAWNSGERMPSEKMMAFELAELRLDATDSVLFAGPLV